MKRLLPLIAMLSGCGSAAPTPSRMPSGYASFQHFGTHPVVDTRDDPSVRVALAADRASWALVHHYLGHDQLPPAEAVRVEDAIAAMAPPVPATTQANIAATIAPSPFRPGWFTLVVTITAPKAAQPERWVFLSNTHGPLDAALQALGVARIDGDVTTLPVALTAHDRVLLVSDGAGFGGIDACAPILRAVANANRAGAIVSVSGDIAPGLDDALLDRIAALGGGRYELITRGEERHLAHDMIGAVGLEHASVEVTFDAANIHRWRLVGHESRSDHQPSPAPLGGLVPAGASVDLLFEIDTATPSFRVHLRATNVDDQRNISATPADDRHHLIAATAAFAEKLRGSFWMKDLAWATLSEAVAALASAAARQELDELIGRAKNLWLSDAGHERPVSSSRSLP